MINPAQCLTTLGQCNFLRGRLKRDIKARIDADPSYASILAFCRTTGERWPEYERMISQFDIVIHYAYYVLGLRGNDAELWGSYMRWMANGSLRPPGGVAQAYIRIAEIMGHPLPTKAQV